MDPQQRLIREIRAADELWAVDDRLPQAELQAALLATDALVVLRSGRPPYRAVLGVPHQAAVGAVQICERRLGADGKPDPRAADENAASFALVAFAHLVRQAIPCKLVVAAHATTHDPNKVPGSPYLVELFAEPAQLLLECHGMNAGRRLDLELSGGCNPRSRPLGFGRLLARRLAWPAPIGVQAAPGSARAEILTADGDRRPGMLERAALKTRSINLAAEFGMPALHLEARPVFRIPPDAGNTVTPAGQRLGAALADLIQRLPPGA